MATWGGAQWVLATFWVLITIGPPGIRAGLIANGSVIKSTWPNFWSKWFVSLFERATLAAILAWGGFW